MIARKLLWTLAFAGLVLTFGSATVAAEPNCIQAQGWIADHHDQLPTTLDQFVGIPAAYQPFVFNVLSPDTKAALWRAHLERYLEQHPKLTAAQVNLIHRAIDLVDLPSTFSTPNDDPLWETLVNRPIQDLEQEFAKSFSRQEMAAILSRLSSKDTVRLQILEVDPASAKAAIQCSCSTVSDWCRPSPYRCYLNNPTCASTASGCGTLLQYACNGTCQNRA